ncbi:serine/threonine-protein kinase [Nocardiopsis composta]
MPSDGLPKNLEPLAAGDPATIGPYVLAGRLGSGGMGTVYLGRAPEKGAHVAIKVIRPELAFDEATRARFHDEMENARRVASFCTAKVLDHGTFENRPYMVTEYIAGTALAEHISEHGPLDSSTLHGFALGVAAALAAIHRAGLVHRDLKPANVLLSLSGPRVIDFGIARAMNTSTNHTQTGIVMGSPGWMAPEQLLEEKVTTAADIFAWGCLVAFAGNGTHPFGNGDAMTLGKRVLFAEPQIGDLDSPLDRLVARALAKEPERRPKAQDLLLELAGGEKTEADNPNDMVSHALNQSWRPNLPPMPPMPPGMPPPGPNPNVTNSGMPHQPAPPPGPPRADRRRSPDRRGRRVRRGLPRRRGPAGADAAGRAAAREPAGADAQRHGPAVAASGLADRAVRAPGCSGAAADRSDPAGPAGAGAAGPALRPAGPPPPHRPLQPTKRRLKWVALTAAVAVVLVTVLIVVLTQLGGGGLPLPFLQQNGQEQDGAQQEPQGKDDAPQAGGDGEAQQTDAPNTASDGRAVFTAHEFYCTDRVAGRSRITGATYCVFVVTVQNTGEATLRIDPDLQTLSVPGEDPERAQKPLSEEEDDPLWRPLESGARADGELIFISSDEAAARSGMLRLRSDEGSAPVDIPVSEVPEAR